jgi:hypothetical protein
MAKKPITETAAIGRTPRERIWTAIRHLKKFELLALEVQVARSGPIVNTHTVRGYLWALIAGGYVARSARNEFTLVKNTGVDAPQINQKGQHNTAGLPRQQMWNAMRICKGDFSNVELAQLASTPEVPVSVAAAAKYIHFLKLAGYLENTVGRNKEPLMRYRLKPSMKTGPKAPRVLDIKQVFDMNTRKIVYSSDPLEAADEQP